MQKYSQERNTVNIYNLWSHYHRKNLDEEDIPNENVEWTCPQCLDPNSEKNMNKEDTDMD